MNRKVIFNKEAKELLLKGVEIIENAVTSTMGPYGRNVLIEGEYNESSLTKDGVTVARSINVNESVENMGINIIKQAAIKTLEQAGDGTTTSTLLASKLSKHLLKHSFDKKLNVTEVRKGMEAATKKVVEMLKENSVKIGSNDQIRQIATLSANGDEVIGDLVTSAIVGAQKEGIVTIEKSPSGETFIEEVEGMQFDKGYKSHYFVTDNDKMSAVLSDAYILLYDKKISNIKPLVPILEKISSEGKSLLIVANDIEGDALPSLIMNKAKGILKVAAVKSPGFGERGKLIMEDIAILTGGQLVDEMKGMSFEEFNMDWLGKARTVTVGKDTTTIIGGEGDEDKIEERLISLKSQIDASSTPFEKESLQERLGKLVGGVFIVNIGGFNDTDINEKKDRCDDALQATRSALAEGISPGAGISLFRISQSKDFKKLKDGKNSNYQFGVDAVLSCLKNPTNKIIENSGQEWDEEWMNAFNKSKPNTVPDIDKKIFVDAFENGVIDPTKVIRCSLQNAVGAAISILLTDVIVYNDKIEDKIEE
jgi:chaperonin GroEL